MGDYGHKECIVPLHQSSHQAFQGHNTPPRHTRSLAHTVQRRESLLIPVSMDIPAPPVHALANTEQGANKTLEDTNRLARWM